MIQTVLKSAAYLIPYSMDYNYISGSNQLYFFPTHKLSRPTTLLYNVTKTLGGVLFVEGYGFGISNQVWEVWDENFIPHTMCLVQIWIENDKLT